MSQQKKIRQKPIVYMEVYGANRVVYRVTAYSNGTNAAYGVSLEDMRTGETASIEDFSNQLERTIHFANQLIQKEIRPTALFDIALGQLISHA